MPFLLLGIAAIAWSGFSLFTGRGYYRGCPPGGYDRSAAPFSFWIPTITILGLGIFVILAFLGLIRLPIRM